MKLINIMGPLNRLDYIIEKYVSKSSIEPVDAMKVAGKTEGVYRFTEQNPYTAAYKKCCDTMSFLNVDYSYTHYGDMALSADEILNYFETVEKQYTDLTLRNQEISKRIEENKVLIIQLQHLIGVKVSLDDMFNFKFMRFRFGRLTKEAYRKMVTFMQDMDLYFISSCEEQGYVYGIYFTPEVTSDHIDSVFASLSFERIRISSKAHGMPEDGIKELNLENQQLQKESIENENKQKELIEKERHRLICTASFIKEKYECFNVRSYAIHTNEAFYISGWVVKSEIDALTNDLKDEKDIMAIVDNPEEVEDVEVPTKLKNNILSRPFESFVRMYGLPSYNEIDPTPILALTYVFMFGMMFGDIGQGAVLAVLGFLFYHFKKNDLGAIFGLAGISAVIFGFLYGSVFGNEHILKPILISPMESTNQLLLTAVGVGVVLLVFAMLLNIINAFKSRDKGKLFFNQNGLAGLVMYIGTVVIVLYSFLEGKKLPIAIVLTVVLAPILIIFFQGPLTNLINGRKFLPKNKGEFFVENIFELVEILLSFVTNTISFIRIGAFALVHAGMMMVVYEFVKLSGTFGSIPVLILGNIFVMGMEGFIVGIQTLRLEFYELFGRFFKGEGVEFKPINEKIKNIL